MNKDTLTYALSIKDGDLITKQIKKYLDKGQTDIIKILKSENNLIGGKTEIKKFKGKKCIIFNSDFMNCGVDMHNKKYELQYLVEILEKNNWIVYINSKDNGQDSENYIPDVNLLIKYSFCNTPNTKLYFSNPNIDLTFGGLNNKWVNRYLNKYKIYSYDYNEKFKIPSKLINMQISDEYLDEIKECINTNKRDINYDKFIIKPLNSFSGNGIFYVNSNCETEEINNKLKNKNFPYVIQPLMENTIRYKNKVMHLRCHILLSCFLKEDLKLTLDKAPEDLGFGSDSVRGNGKQKDYKIHTSLYDNFYITTAKDSKSYDSHGSTTEHIMNLKDYYSDLNIKINLKQITEEIEEINKMFKSVVKKYIKSKKANLIYDDRNSIFALFAPDIMIIYNPADVSQYHIKLVELNYKVGTSFNDLEYDQKEAKRFYNWMYKNGIKPMEK